MDLYRLGYWRSLFASTTFVAKGPQEILTWGRQRIKPWPVRMAGNGNVDLNECSVVGPPPAKMPKKVQRRLPLTI